MVGVLRYNAISYIPLLPLLFIALKPEEQLRVFDHFVTIIAIIYSIGIVSYLLGVLSMNFQISTTIAPNIGRNPYLVFFGHIEESGVSFWRFSSIFDEAGLIGTMNGVILTAIGVSKRDIRSLIILIAGLISFSLAFYIILFINLLFHLNIKKSFLVVLILVIVISISGNIFKELIATRMVFENGRLSGDNRTTQEFDSYFNLFVERGGNDLIFGIGPDYDITTGISSYKTLIISYGIFGLGLMICFYLFSVYEINNSLYGWLLALIFILIAYQRPFMLRYYNIVLFIGGLRYLKKYYLNAE
jgi:hypothetical protein